MGQINRSGIYVYADNDYVQSWAAHQNLLSSSVSSEVDKLRAGMVHTYATGAVARDRAKQELQAKLGATASAQRPWLFLDTESSTLDAWNGSSWVPIYGSTNRIRVGNQTYPMSGTMNVTPPNSWVSRAQGLYTNQMSVPLPFAPPNGWTFAVNLIGSNGFTLAHSVSRGTPSGSLIVRFVGIAGIPNGRLVLSWYLVRF